jgi:hypothetical protein
MKRHVLVNVCPFDIWVSSGTVTSAIIRAPSWQAPPEDAPAVTVVSGRPGVPGVPVIDGSGVPVGRTSVGRETPGLVGGRVDVTNRAVEGAGVSWETLTQEPRLRLVSRSNIQIFFMEWDCTLERLQSAA